MKFHISILWDSLGVKRYVSGYFVLMEELAWEAFLGYLEFSPIVFDVNTMPGT